MQKEKTIKNYKYITKNSLKFETVFYTLFPILSRNNYAPYIIEPFLFESTY